MPPPLRVTLPQVMGLNVDGAHPALNCLKPHAMRNSEAVTKGNDEQVRACRPRLQSCACAPCVALRLKLRPQLILHIPFMGTVRIKAIVIHGGHADEAPRRVKLYVNRDVDFDTADSCVATHTIDMPDTMSDEAEFPLSLAKFNNVGSLSLFVHSNFGGAVARLQYVGLKGTFLAPKVCSNSPSLSHPSPPPLSPPHHVLVLQVRVDAIKNAVYEAKPQLQGA